MVGEEGELRGARPGRWISRPGGNGLQVAFAKTEYLLSNLGTKGSNSLTLLHS
jgi:hypothetical protein